MIRALERRPPDVSYKQLVDVYAADSAARDPEMLQATLLPHLVKRAHVQGSFADFKRRFDESTGGLADRLRSVPGVAFAGGSVTAAICDCGYSDVDIFLVCGLSRAREILELIYKKTRIKLHPMRVSTLYSMHANKKAVLLMPHHVKPNIVRDAML